MDDHISKTLNVVSDIEKLPSIVKEDENLDYAQNNIKSIIESTMDVVPEALQSATENSSPRAWESLSTFLKTVVEMNKIFVDITSKKAYNNGEEEPKTINNNAVFVGTSEDVLKSITQKRLN